MTRTALVTGGTKGIGRAIAIGLAEDGFGVIGLHYGTDAAAAAETADEVKARGAVPVPLRADFADDPVGAVGRMSDEFLTEVERHTGDRTVDVLVNNAGISIPQRLGEIDEATYRRDVEVNLTAPLFLTQRLADSLRDGGRVVNVTTGFTRIAAPTHPVYSATKAALNALTLALAPEFGPRGITVNAVMPGVTDTPMNAGWLSDPGKATEAAALSVFGRIGRPEEVAALVRYLASPQSGWTTGQVIDVSGGSAI
ncbi:NAD(P)-dependent dehydrogenase (short-subunit alcohol dehydrogenase family) [Stackebrandtia albiflava]|uniref:NAD(P)-dependent dehydrogenase (Short-subunit alcohol dehydrogenase family) n=1 Tax=Stackebrandtia albiflava TaxID=406432 RepID=A0A562UY00_9ACTN|nr:SDR family oxidoreductase [Stackebrandtia albiflava]TWJ10477.1 NAD(P)-dependent dehydrogenase (short-subunit alcohol dehydrogenase family) [Stackebrandtia albiflava]